MSGVRRIVRFDRTVADLGRTEAFYRDALGFVREGAPSALPASEAEALGLTGRRATCLLMRLNRQTVGFIAVDPPGAPYPPGHSAIEPDFQHLAIPVRDMESAFAHLSRAAPEPISRGGPQTLPASSGGVAAFKFRDPDGHPLELIAFPSGAPAARWADAPGLFLGIDHSAITVTDLDGTIGLLTGALGLTVAERGLNEGPEQAQLDGLDDPVVNVIALQPPVAAPHVELLHYRRPSYAGPTPSYGPADGVSTRFVFEAEDPAALGKALASEPTASVRISGDGSACFVTGPDHHGFLIIRGR